MDEMKYYLICFLFVSFLFVGCGGNVEATEVLEETPFVFSDLVGTPSAVPTQRPDAASDKDRDGLSAAREEELGTDPDDPDFDDDFLWDGSEDKIHTNPLLEGTDGDEYDDWTEV